VSVTTSTPAPPASSAVVRGEFARALQSAARRRDKHGPATGTEKVLLLLHAAPEWHGDPFIQAADASATVVACPTVLAVLDALTAAREPGSYLIVLTPCEDAELGDNVLAQAIGQRVRQINRWELVRTAFGASMLDPRLNMAEYGWLAEALLDAQPVSGWRRLPGPVLSLDMALGRLAAARLGPLEDDGDGALDAAALLEWTRDETAVARFLALREEERTGLARWLSESIGPVAAVVFRMLGCADITDTIPFGLAAAELYRPGRATPQDRAAMAARVRAEERFFGGAAPDPANLARFAEAVQSLVTRWNDSGHADLADPMCERAEHILADLGASELASASNILDAGFDARVAVLAAEIGRILPAPLPIDLVPVDEAFRRLNAHRRAETHQEDTRAAAAAVRLTRWLATGDGQPPTFGTLSEAAVAALRTWAWVDRALAVVSRADTARFPEAASAYAALCATVRERHAGYDRAFAHRLASWNEASGVSTDLLLAENVLARIGRPVAERQAPLLIVLDAMSTAVGCELAEQIAASRPWVEVSRLEDGREPAIAAIPSITSACRTSLLSGALRTGGQAEERDGFAAFWRGREARLFHKADLRGEAGSQISAAVRDAIRDTAVVVGVVLNTIDDALDHGREDGAAHWTLDGIAYLRTLLDEAWRAGRPVILTADHGHVLDRGAPIHGERAETARFRTGTPGDGEITLRGPRVLAGDGQIVAAWDERIHFAPRRAGYHGGASPAEMVVPVLVFVPSKSLCPKGWFVVDTPAHAPAWWDSPLPGTSTGEAERDGAQAPAGRPGQAAHGPKRKPSRAVRPKPTAPAAPEPGTLFETDEAGPLVPPAAPVGAASLGAQVARSDLLAAQRPFARRAPGNEQIAALIDGLAEAGGKVPVTVAAELAGQPVFRMSGYLAHVARLLNVDGYQIIGEADGGRTVELNLELLRQQFLGTAGKSGPSGARQGSP
jgi:PglZ domain